MLISGPAYGVGLSVFVEVRCLLAACFLCFDEIYGLCSPDRSPVVFLESTFDLMLLSLIP